jgi:nitroreductase
MELRDALRTTGAVRNFADRPVDDATLHAILDDARFAPSGGNRQAWHVIAVSDPTVREAIATVYLDHWHDYIAHLLAGLIPFSPSASDADRALATSKRADAEALSKPDGFAENLATVPALLVVCANLNVLVATDRDLGRYTIAGGASLYPFVWNILLAARDRGLGGVLTTMAIRGEPQLREALHLPEGWAVAAVVALGYPENQVTKLKRKPVEDIATKDFFDGSPFGA